MKQIYKCMMLALLVLMPATLFAQTTVNLGYCAGESTDEASVTAEGKNWIDGAIYLPQAMLTAYDGSQIKAIRAYMISRVNIDTVKVWLRSEFDGPNLAEATITAKTTPKIAKGWNEVALPEAYTIDASVGGLIVGFSYHQRAKVDVFSAVGTPIDHAFYARLGADAQWKDMKEAGALSLEAVVEATSMPEYDLAIISASVPASARLENYDISVTLANQGEKDINGFTLTAYYDQDGTNYDTHYADAIASGDKRTVTLSVPICDTVTAGQLMVAVKSLDEGTDAYEGNNTARVMFKTQKKVLIEEFTTEQCSNCPRVAGYLSTVLASDEYKDRVIAVCHHAGYYTDWLTTTWDEDLLWLYGGSSYAPGMTFDRAPLFGSESYPSPVTCPTYQDIVDAVNYQLTREVHTSLTITPKYDATNRKLSVTVTGVRNHEFGTTPMRLTVYVVENDIEAKDQSGARGTYYHQHVNRLTNATWGDVIEWDNNAFTNNYTFDIEPDWKQDKMQIVALVSGYDASNSANCEIDNAECVPFPIVSGVIELNEEQQTTDDRCYDLSGRVIDQPTKGFYIKNGKKFIMR